MRGSCALVLAMAAGGLLHALALESDKSLDLQDDVVSAPAAGDAHPVLVSILKVAAIVVSFGLNASPIPTMRAAAQRGSTGNNRFAPLACLMLSNLTGFVYGVVVGNWAYVLSRVLNGSLGTYAVVLFVSCADEAAWEQVRWWSGASVVFILFSYGVVIHFLPEWLLPTVLGYYAVFASLLSSSSPLLNMANIIRKRDASEILILFNVMNCVACVLWIVFSMVVADGFIMFQNAVGLVLAVSSLALRFWFPGSRVSLPALSVARANKVEHASVLSPIPEEPTSSPASTVQAEDDVDATIAASRERL